MQETWTYLRNLHNIGGERLWERHSQYTQPQPTCACSRHNMFQKGVTPRHPTRQQRGEEANGHNVILYKAQSSHKQCVTAKTKGFLFIII